VQALSPAQGEQESGFRLRSEELTSILSEARFEYVPLFHFILWVFDCSNAILLKFFEQIVRYRLVADVSALRRSRVVQN
jgi:hypothetical protein